MASAAITVLLCVYAFTKRDTAKGAKSFILCMIVLTVWTLANLLEMSAADLSAKLFWANVQYFAYCYSPVTLISFCMEFTGYDRWIKNKKVLWLAVLPTIIIILVWTDGLHGLIRYGIHLEYSDTLPVIDKKYGPAFFIHAIYSHSLNIIAWILLVRAVLLKNTVYRKQAIILLIGISFIILPNLMYISGLSPVKYDLTPVFFGPAGLITAWGIFKFKLFDVVPLAWATVIKTMDAGVMVLDLQNRVLDINPGFEKIINCTASKVSTKHLNDICIKIPELTDAFKGEGTVQREFSININGAPKVYEVLISPLTDGKGVLIGRLAVTYDITRKKQEQREYLQQQWKQAIMLEKERHARDMHDNLGQVLGFISMQAQGIRQELLNAGIDTVSAQLDKLVYAARSANNEIREYISNARNERLEEDFITSVKQCVQGFITQTGIEAHLNIPAEILWDELNSDVKLNILNIVREALNNIRKHAQAGCVKVSFHIEKQLLIINIEDDGKGFNINECRTDKNSKFGLSIMKERAEEIGAELSIVSAAGKGSRIELSIPVNLGGGKADEGYAG